MKFAGDIHRVISPLIGLLLVHVDLMSSIMHRARSFLVINRIIMSCV